MAIREGEEKMVEIRMKASLCDGVWTKILSKKAVGVLQDVPFYVLRQIDSLIEDGGDAFESIADLEKWITDGALETMGVVHGWYDAQVGFWAYETEGGNVVDQDEDGYNAALAKMLRLGMMRFPRPAVVRMRGEVLTQITYRGLSEDALQLVLRRDGWALRLGDNRAPIEMWENEISRAVARVPAVWDGVSEYVFPAKKILDARRTTKCGVVEDWWIVGDCYGLAIRTPGTDSLSNIAARKVAVAATK